jgi:hypothetical protein
MKKALILVLSIIILLLPLGGCMAPFFFTDSSSFSAEELEPTPSIEAQYFEYEATAWLSQRTHELSGGRFASNSEALAFVQTLYDAGAVAVMATGELAPEDTQPCADSLCVILPQDTQARAKIMRIYDAEVSEYGCNGGNAQEGIYGDTIEFVWPEDADVPSPAASPSLAEPL